MKARTLLYIALPVAVGLGLLVVLRRPVTPPPADEPDFSRAIQSNQQSFVSQPRTEIDYELAESEHRKAEELNQLKHPDGAKAEDFEATQDQKRLRQLERNEAAKAKARDNDIENKPWFNGQP